MTLKLNWGHVLPDGYDGPAWGARAIYALGERAVIDLLWDRMDAQGGTRDERQALCEWLDTSGLAALRAKCVELNLATSVHKHVQIEEGDYIIDANPRESYGYLYICAYRRPCVECRKGVPPTREYSGAVGPFCNSTCREQYLKRPTESAILESYIEPTGERHPATLEPGYDGDEMAARARSVSLRAAVKRTDWAFPPLHNIPAKKDG